MCSDPLKLEVYYETDKNQVRPEGVFCLVYKQAFGRQAKGVKCFQNV